MPRDSGGTYTLPAGNPVVDGTVIESDWANDTMADFAVQLNNVFTRDGLLGPTAPVLFVNGTVALPGIAFQESPSTGIYRVAPSTVGLAIAGVAKQLWTPTAVSIAANTTITGNLGVTGTINATGAITLGGPIDIAGGTVLLPGYTFTGDTNTGIYSPSAGYIGITNDGVVSFYIDATHRAVFEGVNVAASPQMVVKSGTDGYTIDLIGNAANGTATVRFLNNAYSIAYHTITAKDTSTVFNNTGATTMLFYTNNTPRISISGTEGIVTFAAPSSGAHALNGPITITGATQSNNTITTTTAMFAANYWIYPNTTAAAGTVGITAPNGASTVYWGNASIGGGQMDLYSGGARQVLIDPLTTAVNFHVIYGSAGADRITFEADGTATNLGMQWIIKGSGDYAWFGNSGVQLQVTSTASADRWIQMTGGVAASTLPILSSNSNDINCAVLMDFLGTPTAPGGSILGTSFRHIQVSRELIRFTDPNLASADNRLQEFRFDGGVLYGRVLNAAYSGAANWLTVTGGFAAGISGIDFALSNAASGQFNVLRVSRATTSIGYVGVGTVTPVIQLQVTGLAQVGPTTFDAATTGTQGATLFLSDTGTAAGNGGCIQFGAFNGSQPGKHFAAIKAYITDASSNTAGELMICTKNTSADTGSTQALRITADKILYDSRNLPLARDAGATGGSTPPIGSIIMAELLSSNVNALATHAAGAGAGAVMTLRGTHAGTGNTVTAGTWRNLGSTTAGGGGAMAMWIRVG